MSETVKRTPGTWTVREGERCYELRSGESVLEALQRQGVEVDSSCRAGLCQACRLRAVDPPASAQQGLRETEVRAGVFLSCQWRPEKDVELLPDDARRRVAVEVAHREQLATDVLLLRLRPHEAFDFEPGQFVNLVRDDGLRRSYSLASLPREGFLELHVRRVPGGRMSQWLFEAPRLTGLAVEGPLGDCYYVGGRPQQPLILAGVGTGLAPLFGIARHALESGHEGPVTLWQGSGSSERLYAEDRLRELAERWPNFEYRACTREEDPRRPEIEHGALEQRLVAERPDPAARAFVCGNPGFVQSARRALFLNGVSMRDILADPFLPAADGVAPSSSGGALG